MPDLTARAEAAYQGLLAGDGRGLYVSQGWLFNHTIFGRDVAMIARWTLGLGAEYDQVAREVILTLSSLQGLKSRGSNEEEAGRIVNEFKEYSRWQAAWWLRQSNRLVGLVWGGTWQHELGYIGLDSTPLYVQLLCDYATKVDRTILDETVTRLDGGRVLVRQCLLEALAWMDAHQDTNGFLTSRRRNPFSLFFQSWRDSHLAYVYPDGHLASLSRPVVYLEVQATAVDAWRAAAALLEGDDPDMAREWRRRAQVTSQAFFEQFWQPDHRYFAMALDPDRRGRLRPITTPGSSPGWLLDTTIFDDLPTRQRQEYLEAIIRRLGSSEFMTVAGIRARANGSDSGLGLADYHGSWAVWMMDTYVYARGLRRQGLPNLAGELEDRINRAVERGGSFYEFFLVSPAGEVLWRPHEQPATKPKRMINLQILPERDLGWTITACLLIGRGYNPLPGPGADEAWRGQLETEVLNHLRNLPPHPESETVPFGVRTVRGALRVIEKSARALVREYVFRK